MSVRVPFSKSTVFKICRQKMCRFRVNGRPIRPIFHRFQNVPASCERSLRPKYQKSQTTQDFRFHTSYLEEVDCIYPLIVNTIFIFNLHKIGIHIKIAIKRANSSLPLKKIKFAKEDTE